MRGQAHRAFRRVSAFFYPGVLIQSAPHLQVIQTHEALLSIAMLEFFLHRLMAVNDKFAPNPVEKQDQKL